MIKKHQKKATRDKHAHPRTKTPTGLTVAAYIRAAIVAKIKMVIVAATKFNMNRFL